MNIDNASDKRIGQRQIAAHRVIQSRWIDRTLASLELDMAIKALPERIDNVSHASMIARIERVRVTADEAARANARWKYARRIPRLV